VAFGSDIAPPTFRDAFTVYLEGRVHPAHRGRGIGRAVLDWQLDRGAQMHAEQHPEAPGRLAMAVHAAQTSLESLGRRAGMEPVRWYRHMERPLTDLPPVGEAGLVPFTWDRDDEVR